MLIWSAGCNAPCSLIGILSGCNSAEIHSPTGILQNRPEPGYKMAFFTINYAGQYSLLSFITFIIRIQAFGAWMPCDGSDFTLLYSIAL